MSADKKMTIYTIGHSTRSFDVLVAILKAHEIDLLMDIRTIPHSRRNPQFNRDLIEKKLPGLGMAYQHFKELGGLRHSLGDSINIGWKNANFRGYADYMQTSDFTQALERLIRLAIDRRIAVMCAEGNPYRCHRSLVADALVVRGIRVMHVSSATSAIEHRITPFASVVGTSVVYPAEKKDSP
jgi:uncharacterized protein (DUF488 family)